jgi:hypothetical protein
MVILPPDATDANLLAVVRRWVDLLAAGEYPQAQSLLVRDGAERDWPPALVAELIASYELPPGASSGEASRVTTVNTARVFDVQPRHAVSRWQASGRPGVVGDIHFDLPINGVWSDLTAIFWLRQVPGGLVLELFDIHVL